MDCHYILSTKTPTIQVADKPLKLGGKVEHLSVQEFQTRFGFVYNDGISIEKSTKIKPFRENITGYLSSTQLKKQIEKVLKLSNENLVICGMGKFGYGVFASKDIPINTVVTIYGGTLVMKNQFETKNDHACNYYGTSMSISTQNHRGIASFMQHLPEKPKAPDAKQLSDLLKIFGQDISEEQLKLNTEFYSTTFDSETTKDLVATENISKEYLNLDGIPVIAMVASKDIKSGEQLGFNYGYNYWSSREVIPEFFDKEGSVLLHTVYKRTFGQLNFESFTYTGEYKPLVDCVNQRKTFVKVKGDDNKTHEVSAARLFCSLLAVNACGIKINPLYKELFSK